VGRFAKACTHKCKSMSNAWSMTALPRITDSSRTSRHVRKVPITAGGVFWLCLLGQAPFLDRVGCTAREAQMKELSAEVAAQFLSIFISLILESRFTRLTT
jgi:hypothetical protein